MAPVHYFGAVHDPDTGALISDAEVAEVTYTALAASKHPVTARLVVRRVKDRAHDQDQELFPVWRYHPFFTNSTESTTDADITHRRHAIIETGFADLIDGFLAHLPSGLYRPTVRGPSPPASPTTCYAPPAPSPVPDTASPAEPPCAG